MNRCGRCLKGFQHRSSLSRHRQRCNTVVGEKRPWGNEFLTIPPWTKRCRTKDDVVGSSYDPALVDRVINGTPSPPPKAIPLNQLAKNESYKGKGFFPSRGRGLDDDDDDESSEDEVDMKALLEQLKKNAKIPYMGGRQNYCSSTKTREVDGDVDDDDGDDDEDADDNGDDDLSTSELSEKSCVKKTDASDDKDKKEAKKCKDAAVKEAEKLEKARKSLIRTKIRGFKTRLMKLIRDLEDGEVDVSSLRKEVKDYLDNEKDEISQELQSVLDSLKTNSKTFEIGMVLREIEKEKHRLNCILYLLQEHDWVDLPKILPGMREMELIDGELKEKILEKPFPPFELIEIF